MANHLKMAVVDSIGTLHARGWSRRRIARELGIDRETVGRHLRLAGSNPAIVTAGSEAKPAKVTPGISGVRSSAHAYAQEIEEGLDAGLTAQRIWQDLVAEKGFSASYESVKRFAQRLKASDPERVWRMECLAAEEAQVDFGSGWWLVDENGRKRKTHVFRITLSFSRKSYSEAVLHQDTESFIRCLENAFRYFGGVPATLNLDNLKAAVIHADWHDPDLNPKLAEFARHYGTAILPTRPRTPEHKGKIEAGVKYVQNNALKGRKFTSLASLNEFLRHWESSIADLRIHGTTRRQVARHFQEEEKAALKTLPPSLFPCYREGRRHVHRDSFVEVSRAYYHVPCEYIGRIVWARWDGRMVRVLNARMEQIASHVRLPPGKFTSVLGAQGRPCATIEESQHYWSERASRLGVSARAWADAVFEHRGPIGIRVAQGLVALSRKHPSSQIDQAAAKALAASQWRLRDLRTWMESPEQAPQSFPFLESHPLIRDMDAYGALVAPFEENQPTPLKIQTA